MDKNEKSVHYNLDLPSI